jgi:hypothetical protein
VTAHSWRNFLRFRSSALQQFGGAVDRSPDARIGTAAADISGHRTVDIRIRWQGVASSAAADMICPDRQ